MIETIEPLLGAARPLTSPFLAVTVALLAAALARSRRSPARKAAILLAAVALLGAAHWALCRNARASDWLAATESPLAAVFLTVVLPALVLPRTGWYRLRLLVPVAVLAVACAAVVDNYREVPEGEWAWLPMRPAWLIGAVASLLVLVRPLLDLARFRFAVRLTSLLVLLYGGCALRSGYADYQAAVIRRGDVASGVIPTSDTLPSTHSVRRMTYLPGAPCRFTADGGYVQGCNMELTQRLLQLDWRGLWTRDAATLGTMGVLAGALCLFLMISFVAARGFCGWVCPLSSIGEALDWARRRLRLPHYKPARPVKLAYLFSGGGVAALSMLMAKAIPHLGEAGTFAGCKIPIYPFCKVCPSQPICSVLGKGSAAYAPLPTWDLGFGFFAVCYLALLAVFAVSFAAARRLWCRLCPMGMVSGLFNRGGLMKLRKDALKCNRCGVCAEVCPMDIDRVRAEMRDSDVTCYDCLLCLRCVEKCPRDGCLALEHAGVTVAESRFTGS